MARNRRRKALFSFVAGLAAGAVAVAVSLILREIIGGLFLPEIASQTLFSLTPGEFESQAVQTFGPLAKYPGFIGSITANIVVFGTIAIFIDGIYARLKSRRYLLNALLSSAISYTIFYNHRHNTRDIDSITKRYTNRANATYRGITYSFPTCLWICIFFFLYGKA